MTRPSFRRRRLLPAALLSTLGLLAAAVGCRPAPAPDRPVVVAIEAFPTNLDPRIGTDLASSRAHQLLFNGLVRRTEDLAVAPDLAESWEVSPDGTRIVFTLREGLRFHSGRPCTAADVVYTFTSLLDGTVTSYKRGDLEMVRAVTAQGDRRVAFELTEPFAPFVSNLQEFGIVPAGSGPDFARRPDGTGPFQLQEIYQDRELRLVAHPAYFDGPPAIPALTLRAVPNATARQMELLKGSADLVVNDLPPDLLEPFTGTDRYTLLRRPGINYSYLAFNLEDPLLARLEVRRAIAAAIDRAGLITHLLRGYALPATGLLSPANWAYTDAVPRFPYDPAAARQALEAAGLPDPDGPGPAPRCRLTLKCANGQLALQQAAIIQEGLRAVGIQVEVRSFEWATFYEDVKAGNFQMVTLRWVGITDPDAYRLRFHSRYVPPLGANRGRYRNPAADALIEAGSRTLDREERRAIYGDLQRLIAADLPYVSLYYTENVAVLGAGLTGFTLTPAADFSALRHLRRVAPPG